MRNILPVNTEHGLVYVEVHDDPIPQVVETPSGSKIALPEGAEPTGAKEFVIDTMDSLRASISAMAATAATAFAESAPAEWSVEFNIGFKGKASPIPVILSGEGSASVKVVAKWKKT